MRFCQSHRHGDEIRNHSGGERLYSSGNTGHPVGNPVDCAEHHRHHQDGIRHHRRALVALKIAIQPRLKPAWSAVMVSSDHPVTSEALLPTDASKHTLDGFFEQGWDARGTKLGGSQTS